MSCTIPSLRCFSLCVATLLLTACLALAEETYELPPSMFTAPSVQTEHRPGVIPMVAHYPEGVWEDRGVKAHIWHDTKALHMRFEVPLPEDYQPKTRTGRDAQYWYEDAVEVFLRPRGSETLYQMIFSINGEIFDKAGSEKSWNADVDVRSTRKDGTWTLKVSLPLKDIGLEAKDLPAELDFQAVVHIINPADMWQVTAVPVKSRSYRESLGVLRLTTGGSPRVSSTRYIFERAGEKTIFRCYCSVFNPGSSPVTLESSVGEITIAPRHHKWMSFRQVVEGQSPRWAGRIGDIFASWNPLKDPYRLNVDMYRNGPSDIRFRLTDPKAAAEMADRVTLTVGEKTWGPIKLDEVESFVINKAEFPVGKHVARFTFTQDGEETLVTDQEFVRINEEPIEFDLADLDVSRHYAPLEIQGRTIKAALSRFTFDAGALPTAVETKGRNLLAGPVEIRCDGRVLKASDFKLGQTNKNFARFTGKVSDKTLSADLSAQMDYDGLLWVDLAGKLAEKTGRTVSVTIPLEFSQDDIFYNHERLYSDKNISTDMPAGSWNKDMGWGHALPEGTTYVPLTAAVNVVDEFGGMTLYLPPKPNTLELANYDRVIEIRREGRKVWLTLHLSDGKADFPAETFATSFGLQPVPVRTMQDDYNLTQVRKISRPHYDHNLRYLKRLGINIYEVMLWTEIPSYFETFRNEELAKKQVAQAHDLGMKAVFYIGFEISNCAPEYSLYGEYCIRRPRGNPWVSKDNPSQRAYYVCHGSVWGDHYLRGIEHMIEKYDLDGVYMDGTLAIATCCSEQHGHLLRDSRGRIVPYFLTLDKRRFSHILYKIGQAHRKDFILDLHSSSGTWPATMGLVTSIWNGEQTKVALGEWRLPLEILRAQFNGYVYGIPTELLTYGFEDWQLAFAESLPFDTMPRPQYPPASKICKYIYKLWDIYTKYDLRRQYFTGFWMPEAKIHDRNNKALVSYYESPKGLVVILSSHPHREPISVQIDLGAYAEKISPNGRSLFEREGQYAVSEGKLNLELPGGDFRMLVFEWQN